MKVKQIKTTWDVRLIFKQEIPLQVIIYNEELEIMEKITSDERLSMSSFELIILHF